MQFNTKESDPIMIEKIYLQIKCNFEIFHF
jgi:hypothetical protein